MDYRKDDVAFSASTVFGNLFAVSGGQLRDFACAKNCVLCFRLPESPGTSPLTTRAPSGQSLSLHAVVSTHAACRSLSEVLEGCSSRAARDTTVTQGLGHFIFRDRAMRLLKINYGTYKSQE